MKNSILYIVLGVLSWSAPGLAQPSIRPVHLTLKEALQSVDTANLQVLMADARLEQAIARISEAQADLLPHIDGDVNGSRQTVDLRSEGFNFPIPGFGPRVGPFNSFDANGEVSIALFDPSAFERFEAAKKGRVLSQAELEKTREDVLALVAQLFVDAERKEKTVQLLKELLDKDQMAYNLSRTDLAQGTGTELDSHQYKSTFNETQYLYAQAQLQSQDAFLDLGAALHLPAGTPMDLEDDDGFSKNLENASVSDSARAPNADVAAATSQLEADKADQKTAVADFLPRISGSADYGRSGLSPSESSNTYSVGVKATIPIWEGGETQAKLKETKSEVKEAQDNLLDTTQQEEVNIAKAKVSISEADDLRQAKLQRRQTAEQSLRIALQSERIGTGSTFDVMKAQAELAQAEDGYNQAEAAWIMAHIDLLHAQGRLRDLIKR